MKHDITIDIATAKHRFASTWRNKRAKWSEVVASLRDTTRTEETLAAYMKLPKDKQDDIKDVGGFVGGYLNGGKRRKASIRHRQLVCLDVDHATNLDTWLDCRDLGFAAAMYSTHKHQRTAPRYRIVVPLNEPVSPDEYEAIARIIASWLDIDVFDDTTYQANRLMYYPSTAKDGEYLFDVIDAPVLDVDEVLGELDDFGEDPAGWPRSSRELERLDGHRASGEHAEDPEAKQGIVGAFCRAYGIEEAIAEYLSDVYTPCDQLGHDRYTYVGGSTSGGLIVYDNKFAYSHHATDPAGGRLCNAFDLVRLHKFGDMDEGKTIKDINRAPSYKAMTDFAANLPDVKRQLLADRKQRAADDYGDTDELEAKARKRGRAEDWVDNLEMEANGKTVKNTIANVVLILNNDERLQGCFGFNEFEEREVALRKLPWDKSGVKYPRALKNSDDAELRLYLEQVYGITGRGQIADGLAVAVNGNTFHPVRDYLDSVEWDGVERLDTLFIDLFGADDTAYTRAVTRKAFTAAVARIYNAGCKYDYMLILAGEQGTGKSTIFNRMGRQWFSDSITTVTGKEAQEAIQGSWIIEMGELASLRKAEVEAVKHFVSKQEDRFRVAYGKRVEYFPRRCVFFGTTNEEDFLRDATGNRRYWVVNTMGRRGFVGVWDYLDDVTVAQIWAEAKECYEDGETLYLPPKLEAVARDIQNAHLEKDDRTGLVLDYLNRALPAEWDNWDTYMRRAWMEDKDNEGTVTRQFVSVIEVWAECLGNDPTRITRMDSYALSRLMKSLKDWKLYGPMRTKGYGVQKCYQRCN